MKKFNRFLALVLVLSMVLCFVPAQAFAADLTGSSVTLEFWITNSVVRTSASDRGSSSVSISRSEASSEDGVDLSTKAPRNAYSNFDGWVSVTYWQSMRLDSDHEQNGEGGVDRTADGTTMTHIRYWNSRWEYKTLAGNWVAFETGDQLVAYYLQPTTVTDQITTYTKDWGYEPPTSSRDSTPDTSQRQGQVALSVAVVDGSTLTPTEANIYARSTTIFNYWEDRDIGIIAPENNGNYEIYKITVTHGQRTRNASANVWYSDDTITWEKTTNDLGQGQWYDETEVWNISEGTAPMVHGVNDSVHWEEKNDAILVLIYIRAKNAELNVQYVDDSLNGTLIYERGVFAEPEQNFYDLVQTSEVPQADGYFTLDDDASLTYHNDYTDKDIVQTFEKSLLNFQEIAPQYRSGAYYYVGAELDNEGKTLVLHYNIDETKLNPKYVVDFGLSVDANLNDIIKNLSDARSVEVINAAYGEAVINGSTLTYTPDSVLLAPAAVTVKATYADGTFAVMNVGFIPASTVHYEEGFAAYTGSWVQGSTGTGKQTLQTASNANGNYGFDARYAAETGMTNGTEAVSTTAGDKAQLTFTGTGIDIYANCDTDTSSAVVMLKNDAGKTLKLYQVNTATLSGSSAATDGQNVESFNLPIVSIQNLAHGTYTVLVQHTKSPDAATTLRIDGFRVYNTLVGDDTADYAADENAPQFVELRNAVLKGLNVTENTDGGIFTQAGIIVDQVYTDEGTLNGALVLSGNTAYDVQDLVANGPKNELFLQSGDAVTFTINGTAQIGLKALNGTATYTLNGTAHTVTTSNDMFYHEGATGEITIVNTGDNVLSITKLKLFGESILGEISVNQVAATLSMLGYSTNEDVTDLPQIPQQETVYDEAALTVELVDYQGNVLGTATLTAEGVQGEKHIFTADEILAAAAEQMPELYAFVGETAVADAWVNYGAAEVASVAVGLTAVVEVQYIHLMSNEVLAENTIVLVQTDDTAWTLVTADALCEAVPSGYTARYAEDLKAAYGHSYSVAVPVL